MANKNFGNIVKNNLTLEKVKSLVSGPKYTMSREVYEQLLLSALQINGVQDYFNQFLLPTGSTTENEFIINKYFEEVITGVNADIAKKVNITDIVDNLTSTDTDKPLSANQGKILNDICAKKSGVYPNLTAGKLTDPFVIGADLVAAQTWITKFATMTLKVAWVSSSVRFDIVDNNYANINTQPVGVEISASPTATNIVLRAYVLYGNPEILKRIYISYSAVGTFPMTVDLYYVSGSTGYSSIGIKPLWQLHRNINSSLEFITTNTNVSELPTNKTNICVTDLTNYSPITRAYSSIRDGVGNVIPDTYATKAEVSNYNLVINSDFSINQRGQRSYSGNGYTVDRWKGGQSQAKVSVVDGGGVTLSFSEAISNGGTALRQIIDMDASKLIGERMSISTKITAVTGSYWYARLRCSDSSNKYLGEIAATISASGIVSATGTIPANTKTISFEFCVKPGEVPTTDSLTVKWAKLEEGNIATAFITPSIIEELPKCQRYYQRFTTESDFREYSIGFIASTTIAHFSIPLLCEMRTTPTLKISDMNHFTVRHGTDTHGTVAQTTISKIEFRSYSRGSYFLTTTLANTLSISYGVASLRSANIAGYIALDAEIY